MRISRAAAGILARKTLTDAGIEVPAGYHVHHVNEDFSDNRLENLRVLSRSDHMKLHADMRRGKPRKPVNRVWNRRTKETSLIIKVSIEEREMAQALARKRGLTVSSWIRMKIYEEYQKEREGK